MKVIKRINYSVSNFQCYILFWTVFLSKKKKEVIYYAVSHKLWLHSLRNIEWQRKYQEEENKKGLARYTLWHSWKVTCFLFLIEARSDQPTSTIQMLGEIWIRKKTMGYLNNNNTGKLTKNEAPHSLVE